MISMSSKNWLEAHVTDMPVAPPNDPQDRGGAPPGDVDGYLFGQLSPWYLCAAECTDCPQIRRTNMDCFWMRDWAATGFGKSYSYIILTSHILKVTMMITT